MRLGDAITLKRGYDLPNQARVPGGVPIVSSSGVSGDHNEAKIAGPGVVTGRYGTIGQVHYVDGPFWPLNTTLYVQDFKGNHRRFVKYLLETIDFHQFSDKAAVPGINRNHLHEAAITLPPVHEQERIAESLSKLEDRIDNLRQTNTILEAVAQALFKSWFVDFNPVRAKAEGREPEGMDAATAALFPSEFEDSELGPIPKGWRTGTLADVSSLNASKWTARKHPPTVKYIDLSGAHNNRIDQPMEFSFDEAPSRARQHLREGDTIIGTVRPGNRAFAYIHEPDANLTGSTGFAVLSPKAPHLSSYVYLTATRDDAIDRLANLADGGAYPAVRPSVVADTPCVIPHDDVFMAFASITTPLLERIVQNSSLTRTLAETRDTLLPCLISGKLRLPDAQELLEEVAS